MSQNKVDKVNQSKLLANLTDRIQQFNNDYLYQDQEKNKWLLPAYVLMLIVLGFFTGLVMFNRSTTVSNYSAMESYAHDYAYMLYGIESKQIFSVEPEHIEQWTFFAQAHEGVQKVNLVTKVCNKKSLFSSSSSCFFSYQTRFNDGSTSMTYGIKVTAELDVPVAIELQNIRAGTMLLTEPEPFNK